MDCFVAPKQLCSESHHILKQILLTRLCKLQEMKNKYTVPWVTTDVDPKVYRRHLLPQFKSISFLFQLATPALLFF